MSAINQPTHGRGPAASNFLRRNYNTHLFFDRPWVDRGAVCWLAPWICFAVFLWGKSQQRWKCWPPTRGLAKDPQPAEEDCQVTRHGAEEQRGIHVCPPRQVWSLQSLTAARSPPGRAGPIPAWPGTMSFGKVLAKCARPLLLRSEEPSRQPWLPTSTPKLAALCGARRGHLAEALPWVYAANHGEGGSVRRLVSRAYYWTFNLIFLCSNIS